MGFFDRFKNKKEQSFDPLNDLTLTKLKVGYMLDYDMKTFEVTKYFMYEFQDDFTVKEWELTSGDEKLYLEMYEDDGLHLSVSRKIPLGMIKGGIKKYIMENDDPPDEIYYKDKPYYLDETLAGHMFEDGKEDGAELISWTFIDEENESFVSVEQWGEEEFEAVSGKFVKEYQLTNILPYRG